MKKIIALIPARMNSSRFPGKPLAKILDLPMIEHVRRRVALSDALHDVYVATCDQEILEVVQSNGGKAIMTANTHERCTDRIEEAARTLDADIVVMVQGDEPLFDYQILPSLIDPLLQDERNVCTNLISIIENEADLKSVDVVKAVLDQTHHIFCFSRLPIPYQRVKKEIPYYRQTGLAAFTKSFLKKFTSLPPTPMEQVESVDFLRILEHRYPILGVVYSQRTIGVDRIEDISAIEEVLLHDSTQQEIYQRILNQ